MKAELPAEAARQLREDGFCVIPGPVPVAGLDRLADAYDHAMAEADPIDRREGSTTLRVHNLAKRHAEFDSVCVFPPLLDACRQILTRPFRLSTMLGRTLLPRKPAQPLHVDGTLVGFILMVDEFREENGATRFLPGSHHHPSVHPPAGPPISAAGPAGSLIVYNGSVWHGHGANTTEKPRRSIQGAFVCR